MSAKVPNLGVGDEVQAAFSSIHRAIITHADAMARLSRELDEFLGRLAKAYTQNEFIDRARALRLHQMALAMLSICREQPDKDHVPCVLAAINYFVCELDANPDFENPFDGFDDDEQVLLKVIELFNLDSLVKAKLGGAA